MPVFAAIRKFLILALLTLFVSQDVSAQQKIRLTSNWEFLKQDLGGIWEAVRPVTADKPESVPLWQSVSLPHCFNNRDAVDPDGNYYQGPGWYRTRLDIKNTYVNGRTLLHFEGAGQKTDVYVYNTKVASHLGGYDEWTVDVTDAIECFRKTDVYKTQFTGEIPIEIRCDNSRDVESIPSRMSDFCVYGGIYRYLNLEYVPALSLSKIFASAEVDKEDKQGSLHIKTRFFNPSVLTSANLTISVADPDGKIVATSNKELTTLTGDVEVAAYEFKKPALWSPQSPVLYTVKVTVVAAGSTYQQIEKIGFRNFEFAKNGPFYLNGKRLLLQGTHRHEDQAGVAAAITDPLVRKEMKMIKDMGTNFIRLSHYQQSPLVLHLCDSLGLLVWEEEPWCRGGLGETVYQNQARDMLTNMIEQHYNHPAIIIWSLGNENDWEGDFEKFDKQKIRAFMQQQNDLAHKLDPSRKTAIRRCEFCKDIVDVYSPSIWAGWYAKESYTHYKNMTEKAFKAVDRFIHVEWGGDSHSRRHAENPEDIKNKADTSAKKTDSFSKDGDWSETYICNLYDWTLKEQETMPWLSGTAFWTFKDFATPLRPDNPIPFMNQKGVVEHDLTPKEAYYVFQSYWAPKLMAHIYGHTWPVRWGAAGEQKVVKVYSNCDEAELFVNNKSYGARKRNSQDFPAAGLHWMVPYQKGYNQIKVIAKKGESTVTDEITQQYQTEKWGKPARLVFEKTGEKDGIATVQVKLYDAHDVQCLDATNWISFSLAGDGKLLDDLGTSTGSRKVQAYNGRATIRIETKGGKSVAGVQSPGLKSMFIYL
jgi:beta-galactosidase